MVVEAEEEKCCVRVFDTANGELLGEVAPVDGGGAFQLEVAGGRAVFGTLTSLAAIDLDEPLGDAVTVSDEQAVRAWVSADGSVVLSGDEAGSITLHDGESSNGSTDLGAFPGIRGLFVRADGRALVGIVGDHLVEVSTTGREPLSTEPFGDSGDAIQAIASNGELAYFCRLPPYTPCRAVDPRTGEEIAGLATDRELIAVADDEQTALWLGADGDTIMLAGLGDEAARATAALGVDAEVGWWAVMDEACSTLIVVQEDGVRFVRRSMTDLAELPAAAALEPRLHRRDHQQRRQPLRPRHPTSRRHPGPRRRRHRVGRGDPRRRAPCHARSGDGRRLRRGQRPPRAR